MNSKIHSSIDWYLVVFFSAFYCIALALPISEALKQIAVIVIILIGIHLIFKKELKIEENILAYSAGGMVIFSLISGFLAVFDRTEALKSCIDIFRIMMIFLIIKSIPLSIKQLIVFNKILFLSMTVALLYGLYEFYFFPNIYPQITYLELHSIGHVNHSSIYLLVVFTIAISWLFCCRDNKVQNISTSLLLFIIITSFAGIFLTGSRATMLTSILLILLLFIVRKQYTNPKLLLLLGIFIIISLTVLFSNEYSLDKLLLGFDMTHRQELINASIQAWLDHNIFFGIGADNSHYINPQDYVQTNFTEITHAHNTYITYLLERGLFGIGLYLIFIFSVLIALIKQYGKTKDSLVTAALLIWLANFIISWVNTSFHDENGLLMAIIWGLALNQHLRTKVE